MFIQRLKSLREESDISQAKLAELINISQQAIGKWETGKSTPDPTTIVALAKIFNVSTDYLLGKTNVRAPITTIAAHRTDIGEELNEEGKKQLNDYLEYLKQKYSN